MTVEELEKLAGSIGLLIKIQVRETIGLCFFRIVIAEQKDNIIKIWAEMKGWTYLNKQGIQLDTLIILSKAPPFVSELIWATTMAWAIEKKSNLLISKFYNLIKGKIKIIGVGGVDSGKAAYDKFLLGADYVQLYTGMVFQGPNIAGMIKKDLKELLIRDGVKNFTEIVGNKTVS